MPHDRTTPSAGAQLQLSPTFPANGSRELPHVSEEGSFRVNPLEDVEGEEEEEELKKPVAGGKVVDAAHLQVAQTAV